MSQLKNIINNIKNYYEFLKTKEQLNRLTDHELRDIGLSRASINNIAFEVTHKNRQVS